MEYRVNKLCGRDDYTVKLNEKIDSNIASKILDVLRDFEIKSKSSDSIWLQKGDKKIFIFYYGEILFTNFTKDEVTSIVNSIVG
jgi:uncharacterized Rmd1/YagE family protein